MEDSARVTGTSVSRHNRNRRKWSSKTSSIDEKGVDKTYTHQYKIANMRSIESVQHTVTYTSYIQNYSCLSVRLSIMGGQLKRFDLET